MDWSEEQTLQILNKGIQKQQTGQEAEGQAFQEEVLLLGQAAGSQPPLLPQPLSVYIL